MDDDLAFWRGALLGLPVSVALWTVIAMVMVLA